MPKGYRAKIMRNSSIKPITPIRCGKQKCEKDYSYKTHVTGCWLLHFVLSGKGRFTNMNGTHEVTENQVFVIRPFETASYSADSNDPWTYIWIAFHSDIQMPVSLMSNDVISAPYLRESFISAFDRSQLFTENDKTLPYEYYLCGSIWKLLGLIMFEENDITDSAENTVTTALNIIKSEYHTPITVNDIAARLHITRTYFSQMFKAHVGTSPKKYLNEIRMERAAELLSKNSDSVSAIADSVGYSDVFIFSRAFKTYYQCSPTEYIRKHKFKS